MTIYIHFCFSNENRIFAYGWIEIVKLNYNFAVVFQRKRRTVENLTKWEEKNTLVKLSLYHEQFQVFRYLELDRQKCTISRCYVSYHYSIYKEYIHIRMYTLCIQYIYFIYVLYIILKEVLIRRVFSRCFIKYQHKFSPNISAAHRHPELNEIVIVNTYLNAYCVPTSIVVFTYIKLVESLYLPFKLVSLLQIRNRRQRRLSNFPEFTHLITLATRISAQKVWHHNLSI